jgi:hypothetical protein
LFGWCNAALAVDRNNRCQSCCNASTIGGTRECSSGFKCQRDEQTCKSGVVINPPGLLPQACSITGGAWEGKEVCFRESIEHKCYVVINTCKDITACGADGQVIRRTESSRYVCGFCLAG